MQVKDSLYQRIARRLQEDIGAGVYSEDKRLPGYRELAHRYGASDRTMLSAVNYLERNGVLQRLARSGTYIAPEFLTHGPGHQTMAVVLAETVFSNTPNSNAENLAGCMEILRGAMHEAHARLTNLEVRIFAETVERLTISHQQALLQDFSSVIFISRELPELRNALEHSGKTVVNLIQDEVTSDGSFALHRTLTERLLPVVRYAMLAKYRHVDVITYDAVRLAENGREGEAKERLAEELFTGMGLTFRKHPWTTGNGFPWIAPNEKDRLVFAMSTEALPELYHELHERRMVPGQDVDIVALASYRAYNNFMPTLCGFRIPYFNVGRALVQLALTRAHQFNFIPEFVPGASARPLSQQRIKQLSCNK